VASLTGSIFGDSIWRPSELLGDSSRTFPGSPHGLAVKDHRFGLCALLWAGVVGLIAGVAVHIMVIGIKKLHHPVSRLRGGNGHGQSSSSGSIAPSRWQIRLRRAVILAAVGATNGGIAVLFPSTFFWGEEQLQIPLTRGCIDGPNPVGLEPAEMPFLYKGLLERSPPLSVPTSPCEPMPAWYMAVLGFTKFALILVSELSGFVGGSIYPVVFACASLGSAVGALPWVSALGGQYVYVSTAAAIAVGLAALLNAKTFALIFVVVIQENVPFGHVSTQLMSLLFAVSLHYLFSRVFLNRFPNFNMIATQAHRQDVKFFAPTWEDTRPVSDTPHESEDGSEPSSSDEEDERRTTVSDTESEVQVF